MFSRLTMFLLLAFVPLRALAPVQGPDTSPAAVQSASPAVPRFEVVSVKPCRESLATNGRGGGATSPGTLRIDCQTVNGFVQLAYVTYANGTMSDPGTVYTTPVEGGPDWVNSERYSIEAKPERPAGRGMMMGPMLRVVLEDRFKLRVRRVRQEIPIYELTIAKGGH